MIVAVADEIWMIDPPEAMPRTSACMNWNGPTNCSAVIAASSSAVVSRNGLIRPQPVAFTPMSDALEPGQRRIDQVFARRLAGDVAFDRDPADLGRERFQFRHVAARDGDPGAFRGEAPGDHLTHVATSGCAEHDGHLAVQAHRGPKRPKYGTAPPSAGPPA